MDLALNDSQQMLQRVARDFVEREAPRDAITALQDSETGFRPELWETAASLGWLGMLIPPEYGGSGGSVSDAAVLFEELGRGPLPGPFFSSGVLGALTVLEAGTEEQRRGLLPAIAAGREIVTLALTDPDCSWGAQGIQLVPERRGGSY